MPQHRAISCSTPSPKGATRRIDSQRRSPHSLTALPRSHKARLPSAKTSHTWKHESQSWQNVLHHQGLPRDSADDPSHSAARKLSHNRSPFPIILAQTASVMSHVQSRDHTVDKSTSLMMLSAKITYVEPKGALVLHVLPIFRPSATDLRCCIRRREH